MKTGVLGRFILVGIIFTFFCSCLQNNDSAEDMNLWPKIEPF